MIVPTHYYHLIRGSRGILHRPSDILSSCCFYTIRRPGSTEKAPLFQRELQRPFLTYFTQHSTNTNYSSSLSLSVSVDRRTSWRWQKQHHLSVTTQESKQDKKNEEEEKKNAIYEKSDDNEVANHGHRTGKVQTTVEDVGKEKRLDNARILIVTDDESGNNTDEEFLANNYSADKEFLASNYFYENKKRRRVRTYKQERKKAVEEERKNIVGKNQWDDNKMADHGQRTGKVQTTIQESGNDDDGDKKIKEDKKAFLGNPGEPSTMTAEKQNFFEELSWIRSETGDNHEFLSNYLKLQEYKKRYGDCLVPRKPNVHCNDLAFMKWVCRQRALYRTTIKLHQQFRQGNQTGKKWYRKTTKVAMNPLEFHALKRLDFEPEYNYGIWNKRYNELKLYRHKYGNCRVPYNFESNLQLGEWVHKQRVQFHFLKKGKPSTLTSNRLELLNEINFEWGSTHTEWEDRFQDLQEFYQENGHSRVPRGYPRNPKLSDWVYRQRHEYKLFRQGKPSVMTTKRVKQLNQLTFSWTVTRPVLTWEKRLKQLQEFKNKCGHTRVPRMYRKNLPLGHWVYRQRVQYKLFQQGEHSSTTMTRERIEKLEQIGFDWESDWDKRFKELQEFKKSFGHTRVPINHKDYPGLGVWVCAQRRMYRLLQQKQQQQGNNTARSATMDHIELLERIGFEWRIYKKEKEGSLELNLL